ncbi:MAG: MBL fold metallo-hydrolase [Gammaproteobacteria bacterium]|nr:MBL fold metallo-hydrolase [Gammaproteobacteria bacterium]
MAEFVTLAQDIYCIDALYMKPQVASIYLLRQGDEVALIETGTCHSLANVLATLDALAIDQSQVKYVIPTHVHLDHAGGAGAMMRHFEQAQLLVHARGANHMIDPRKLIEGTIGVYGEDKFERLYGRIEPVATERVTVVEGLAKYSLGDRDLIFIDTPGHARHHFCIYDERSNGVFTGDTFGICYAPMKVLPRGLLPTTPPVQFDPGALRQSITRIMEFEPQRLYLTHYGELADPDAQLESFNLWVDEYVGLSRQFEPDSPDYETDLEQALMQLVMQTLCSGPDPALQRILQNDINLNAQGLAHWRRRDADA